MTRNGHLSRPEHKEAIKMIIETFKAQKKKKKRKKRG